jgi:hypothetical protein
VYPALRSDFVRRGARAHREHILMFFFAAFAIVVARLYLECAALSDAGSLEPHGDDTQSLSWRDAPCSWPSGSPLGSTKACPRWFLWPAGGLIEFLAD